MQYIIGVAPAQSSKTMQDGRLAAWCRQAECGRRVRALFDEGPASRFLNASDASPATRLKGGKKVDRQPNASLGRDLLCQISEDHRAISPARILVLGLGYWRRAIGLLIDSGRVGAKRYQIPVASAFPLYRADGEHSADVTLLPHPRFFPTFDKERSREATLAFTIECLVRQNHRSGVGGRFGRRSCTG